MSTPENILAKIKLLFNLQNSSNINESANAKRMADNLIDKYGVSKEELDSLADKKPIYCEDDLLYSSIGLISWKQRLALTIAKQLYCHIVQEESVPMEGPSNFSYFIYGDLEDAENVRHIFNLFSGKIEELINKKCYGRGPIYIHSYSEGVVESISNNIYWNGIDLPKVKKPVMVEDKILNNGDSNISKHKEEKEKPIKETVNVNAQSLIKDIQAFYRGIEDGKDFSINDILELDIENQNIQELNE